MDYTFTIVRTRPAVTQGFATVYLNREELLSFGDKIELIKEGEEYFGENIGGWASVMSDGEFVYSLLFHTHDDIYHYSEKVRKILKSEKSDG